MRPLALAVLLSAFLSLATDAARAEFSLFGSAGHTPANPFASNYASPPVRGAMERPRRPRRPAPDVPRPPRDIPR